MNKLFCSKELSRFVLLIVLIFSSSILANGATFTVINPGKAKFFILQSSNNQLREEQFGATGDIPVAGDWDGDGKADIGVYRAGTQANPQGYFYYRPSSRPSVNFVPYPWGISGDKPVVSDYGGDGKADLAVFRPSNGVWYIWRSRDGFAAAQFGVSTDKPVPADYDGDGKPICQFTEMVIGFC
jgi:hypothetical protein